MINQQIIDDVKKCCQVKSYNTNICLSPDEIQSHIRCLTLKGHPKKPLRDVIPNFITHLKFGDYFDMELGDCIPSSVTNLVFGCDFDKPLGNSIPSSVTRLVFGACFNQPLGKSIPLSVTFLKFGHYFNQPICDSIPFSVTHLTLEGPFFDHPTDPLPSVTHLSMTRNKKMKKNHLSGSFS